MGLVAAILGLILVFAILGKVCDQYFVKSLDIISEKLKLSQDVAGATLMAIGTSAPELSTAIIALTKGGAEEVGAGTIVGSAIFNILVIIGASAVLAKAYLKWQPVVRDMSVYVIAILMLLLVFGDGTVTLAETAIFLGIYAVYILILARWSRWFPSEKERIQKVMEKGFQKKEDRRITLLRKVWDPISNFSDHILNRIFPNLEKKPQLYLLTFAISIAFIIGLSYLLVELATFTAHEIGVPPVIIALTVLAAGTSIPDLIASLIVAKQGRGDMAVSNAVGSNSFDIYIGLGLPWFFYAIITGENVPVGTENLFSSVILLFATVVAVFFIIAVQKWKIGRKAGYLLIALYAGYLIYMITLALVDK